MGFNYTNGSFNKVGQMGGFRPDVSTPYLWFDPVDSATITKDGSDRVSQIDDKSVNGRNGTQGTAANQPLWVDSVQNGLPIIRFDGVRRLVTGNLAIGAQGTIFVVVKAATQAEDGYIFWRLVAGSDQYQIRIGSPANRLQIYNNFGGGFDNVISTQDIDIDTFNIITYQWNSTVGDFWVNGVSQPTSGNLRTRGLELNNWGEVFDGDIGETIVYDSVLSGAARTEKEQYLSAKWGVSLA